MPKSAVDALGWVPSDRLGTAYGTIETLFILMQITITMLLGVHVPSTRNGGTSHQ